VTGGEISDVVAILGGGSGALSLVTTVAVLGTHVRVMRDNVAYLLRRDHVLTEIGADVRHIKENINTGRNT